MVVSLHSGELRDPLGVASEYVAQRRHHPAHRHQVALEREDALQAIGARSFEHIVLDVIYLVVDPREYREEGPGERVEDPIDQLLLAAHLHIAVAIAHARQCLDRVLVNRDHVVAGHDQMDLAQQRAPGCRRPGRRRTRPCTRSLRTRRIWGSGERSAGPRPSADAGAAVRRVGAACRRRRPQNPSRRNGPTPAGCGPPPSQG